MVLRMMQPSMGARRNGGLPSLDEIARALAGDVSGNQVLAPGQGHSAQDRSLCVRIDPKAPDGFLVHSFAGDDPIACKDYVRSKVGLPQWSADTAERGPREATRRTKPRVVAEYVYCQPDGTRYLRVQRTEPKSAFPQSYWTGTAWASGKPRGLKIPYRLPEMIAAVHDVVFICEGEKDVDALIKRGFVATTNSEGAGKWTEDLNSWFADKEVFILADNDEPGRRHANAVAEHLKPVAREVRVIDLPSLPPKGDVSDWLDAGNDPSTLLDLCRSFPLYGTQAHANGRSGPLIRTAHDLHSMRFPEISFVVPSYIVEGLTLFAGNPKIGKSWLCLDIGLAVARGAECLGGEACQQGDVLYLALEDNPRRLQKRIQTLLSGFSGAWPRSFHFATEWQRADCGGIEEIRRWAQRVAKPRLVVVDVLAMFRGGRRERDNSYLDDYEAMKGLQVLALELNLAIIVVHHNRKSREESDPFEKVSGTMGLSGGADTIIILSRDGAGTTLYGRGRDLEEVEVAFEFDRETCRWRALGEAAEVRRTDQRAAILGVLAKSGEPMCPADIASAIRVNATNVRQLLLKMTKVGEVRKVGRARYAHPDVTTCHTSSPDNNDNDNDDYRGARDGDDL
jgi:hypothetical protein